MQFVVKSSYDKEFDVLIFNQDREKTPFDLFELLLNDFYSDRLTPSDIELINDLIVTYLNGFATFLISLEDTEWLLSLWKEQIKMTEIYIQSLIDKK